MEINDIWNDFCYHIKNKSRNALERDFQPIAESLFEKLGWLRYRGEIVTQETIPVGSSNSARPDIVIKSGGQNLFVVELKKANISISNRNIEQLISYMRLLKLNFGILLGDTLQIYYELPDSNKPPIKINEISYVNDSSEGIDFIKLLNKKNYTFEKFQEYCNNKLINIEKLENIKKYVNLLCSEKGSELIIDLLKEKLRIEFTEENITSILDEINIHISRKNEITRPIKIISDERNIVLNNESDDTKISKKEAERLCRHAGITINGEITFASKNRGVNTYWANPDRDFLNQNWWLLLNDYVNCNLHIFNIPANSISVEQLLYRNDDQGKIDLQIRYGNDQFEDKRSGIQFINWFVRTIEYENIL